MTPKEKAKQLVDDMMPFVYIDKSIGQYFNGKHCAIIAVNEIIDELTSRGILSGFWYEVHEEIKKL